MSSTRERTAASAADARSPAPVIHPSLVRPELTLGVERYVIGLEATLCFALVTSHGVHLATMAVVAAVCLVIHPVMAWLTARDPQVSQVYVRSRRHADFYLPHGAPLARVRAPAASIPRVR